MGGVFYCFTRCIMVVERTETEVIIRLPASVDTEELQDLLDYMRYKELTAGFRVSQDEANALAREARQGWWAANRDRLLK